MKKLSPHISFSIFLQIFGILINGILGMSLEMIALLIINLKNKKTLNSLLKKFVFVVISQILIDILFGNDAMLVEMIFLYLEKISVGVIVLIKILIGLLISIFFKKYTLNKSSQFSFPIHSIFIGIILESKKQHFPFQNISSNLPYLFYFFVERAFQYLTNNNEILMKENRSKLSFLKKRNYES